MALFSFRLCRGEAFVLLLWLCRYSRKRATSLQRSASSSKTAPASHTIIRLDSLVAALGSGLRESNVELGIADAGRVPDPEISREPRLDPAGQESAVGIHRKASRVTDSIILLSDGCVRSRRARPWANSFTRPSSSIKPTARNGQEVPRGSVTTHPRTDRR